MTAEPDPLIAQLEEVHQRSYWTVQNGHAWTASDHQLLERTCNALLERLAQAMEAPKVAPPSPVRIGVFVVEAAVPVAEPAQSVRVALREVQTGALLALTMPADTARVGDVVALTVQTL